MKVSLLGLTEPYEATDARRLLASCGATTSDSSEATLFNDILFLAWRKLFVQWRNALASFGGAMRSRYDVNEVSEMQARP